jgi:hypothetical protein
MVCVWIERFLLGFCFPEDLMTSDLGESGLKYTRLKASEKVIARSDKYFIQKCNAAFLNFAKIS